MRTLHGPHRCRSPRPTDAPVGDDRAGHHRRARRSRSCASASSPGGSAWRRARPTGRARCSLTGPARPHAERRLPARPALRGVRAAGDRAHGRPGRRPALARRAAEHCSERRCRSACPPEPTWSTSSGSRAVMPSATRRTPADRPSTAPAPARSWPRSIPAMVEARLAAGLTAEHRLHDRGAGAAACRACAGSPTGLRPQRRRDRARHVVAGGPGAGPADGPVRGRDLDGRADLPRSSPSTSPTTSPSCGPAPAGSARPSATAGTAFDRTTGEP